MSEINESASCALIMMSRRPLRSVFRFVALPPELGGKHKCTIVCFLIDVPAQKLGDVQIYREREMLEEFLKKTRKTLPASGFDLFSSCISAYVAII